MKGSLAKLSVKNIFTLSDVSVEVRPCCQTDGALWYSDHSECQVLCLWTK